jgi:hypothetical protein
VQRQPQEQASRLAAAEAFFVAQARAREAAVVAGSPVPIGCLALERARSSAVEHLTFNQVVVGSIPTGLTK